MPTASSDLRTFTLAYSAACRLVCTFLVAFGVTCALAATSTDGGGADAPQTAASADQGSKDSDSSADRKSPKRNSQETTRPGLEEVIVTAQRRAESTQNVPMGITAFDDKMIEEAGAVRFEDLALMSTGVNFSESGPSSTKLNIRGVSDGPLSPNDVQTTVGQYIDEMIVSINGPAPGLRLFDIERVEVLRGPQGTLYGDASVGGTVRMITHKADASRFETAEELTLSNTEHGSTNYAVDAMINVPIIQNELAVRAVAYHVDDQGFIDDVVRNIPRVNKTGIDGGRLSLRYQPNENLRLTLNSIVHRDYSDGRYSYKPSLGDLLTSSLLAEEFTNRFQMHNATLEYAFSGADLLSSTTYSSFEQLQYSDISDVITSIFGVTLPSWDRAVPSQHAWAQEFRLTSRGDTRFKWLTGLYYFHTKGELREEAASIGIYDLLASLGQPIAGTPLDLGKDVIFRLDERRTRAQIAVFADLGYQLTEKLEARAGARWFDTRFHQDTNPGGLAFGGPPITNVVGTSENKVMTRWLLAYHPTAAAMVYASASQGFRVGGLNSPAPGAIPGVNFPASFQSETLWNYEIGTKTTWLDRRLLLNVTGYWIDWSNTQVPLETPQSFTFIGNVGSARIKGLEFETVVRPVEALTLSARVSWTDAEARADVPLLSAKPGDRLPAVPRVSYSASAEYSHPFTSSLTATLRADYQHVGQMLSNFETLDNAFGDYNLVHLRAAIDSGPWNFALFARNLTDKRAVVAASTTAGIQRLSVARPRTVGLSVYYHF